ncbi:hypothetical protein PENTCL1PPCAC_7291, partial [Pristionchus entomophagus]
SPSDRLRSDSTIEQRLLALSQENELLKSRLESRAAMDSLMGGMPALPAASATAAAGGARGVLVPHYGAPTSVITARYAPAAVHTSCSSTNATAAANLPMLQLAQLQAAIQQQLQLPSHTLLPSTSSSSPLLLSSSSAFQPFSVIKKSPERKVEKNVAPDSSTSDYPSLRPLTRTDSLPSSTFQPAPLPSAPSGGLLSAILSAPPLPPPSSSSRISPLVPRSSTEHWSGLVSPPRDHHGCSSSSKSDNESAASSSSLSPSGSGGSSQGDGHSGDPKRVAYMDRRKRNNEAAKRCRANRRAVFEYRSRRVQVLETENDTLRDEIAVLRREIDQYKNRLVERGLTVPSSSAAPTSVIARAPASSSPSYSS